ncbi:hypothetical protein BJ170DRAFT_598790 [Xylariales sp. AK1849]|nr:hypothetical protein BJ170DRAFT_598790 [Xylariales sp. AK1849]
MKSFTSILISLMLASVAVADLPYGMPNDKRDVEGRHPEFSPPPGHTHTWHHSGTGGPHPTGGHGGHHKPTGGYGGGGKEHTTLRTHTGTRPHHPHHTGTGGQHHHHTGTGVRHHHTGTGGHHHHTGTGGGHPTGTDVPPKWTLPAQPRSMHPQ